MFWDPAILRDHQKMHHHGQDVDSDYEPQNDGGNGGDEDSESETDSKFGDFFCEICGTAFHRHDLLNRHIRTHVKKEVNESGGGSNANNFFGMEAEGHCCNVCGDTFKGALELLAHAEVHARFQPFK